MCPDVSEMEHMLGQQNTNVFTVFETDNSHTHTHSYYPLVPPYRREEPHPHIKAESDSEPRPPSEINMDYIQAFDERRATLPTRPDLLLLPSDLKPFIKVSEKTLPLLPIR